MDLSPLAVSGSFSLKDLKLDQLAPYLKDVLPSSPAGVAEVTARYRAGNTGNKLDVTVEQIEAKLAGLHVPLGTGEGAGVRIGSIALKGGNFDLSQQTLAIGSITLGDTRLELPRIERSLELASITLEDARINLAERQAKLAKVALTDGSLRAARSPEGKIYILEALTALANSPKDKGVGSSAAGNPATAAQPWRFLLDQFELADFNVSLHEEGISPAAEFKLEGLALQVKGISENLNAALPVKLAFNVATGGRFEAEGSYAPAGPVADIKLKLTDLALKPAEPYLASKAALDIAGGRLSTQGRVKLDAKGQVYRGDFTLRDLRLNEAGTSNILLGWKNLSTSELTATPQRLDIGELRLNGLDTKLIIDKEKNINLKKVIKPAPAAVASAPAEAVPPAPTFTVSIDRLRFYNGDLYFADHSLILPFGTRIHGMRGSINHLSSRPGGTPAQLELEGEVDEYGMARSVGQFDLFDPTGFMDIRVLFRNVEMTRLTPYMATFAGRKIDSGKLSLDLQYKLKQRQLQGENQITIDRLTLGERVESASAKDLPLDLAIAILQDSDGRIDLGLPIAGSLDDPEFSYGTIVWKAITNVLTKIVTAPFRALASIFGGSEKMESIVFEAGVAQLTPPEREKLVRLAEGLAKRPGLVLAVAGTYAEADRIALQDVQLRRAIMARMGQTVPDKYDPGPLSTRQPAVREALEKLFAERIGASDLAALKEGFRRANPGELEEGVAGKMMSRLSGLLREKKTLNEDEVAQLKGADFYAILYERLRAKESVGDERLQALGQARAEFALATLKSAGMAAERIQSLPPEKGETTESTGGNVPLKLGLEAGKK
jgi:hypothetical protein